MGVIDSLKGLVRGNKNKVKYGIDEAADKIVDKVGQDHKDKVDKAADAAKGVVDKLAE